MKWLVCMVLFLLVTLSSPLMAWTQFTDGRIHTIGSTISGDVWVDYNSPGAKTTLNVVAGGSINSGKLQMFEDSSMTMTGGIISDGLISHDNSLVTLDGGLISRYLETHDNSTMVLNNGSVDAYLNAMYNSQIIMNGGLVTDGISAWDNSKATINEGSLGCVRAMFSSNVIVNGGSIGTLQAYDSGVASLNGGHINNLEVAGDGRLTWSGGKVDTSILCRDSSILTIYGTDFAVDGIPVMSGSISSLTGEYLHEPDRRITGILADGNSINSLFRIGGTSSVVLVSSSIVPEPSNLLALGVSITSLLGLFWRKSS